METLRTLMDRGQSVKEWNDMPEAAWRGHALSSAARVPGHGLSVEDRISAASIGGCYFERGYELLIQTTARPLVKFTRTGGIG